MSSFKNNYYARFGKLDLQGCISYYVMVLPPIIDIKESEKPVINIFSGKDEDETERMNLFAVAKNSSVMVFHKAHEGYSHLCLNGYNDYDNHNRDSIRIVTKHFFSPIMQQSVDVKRCKKGKEEIVRGIENVLIGEGFFPKGKGKNGNWRAEDLMRISEKQKSYLEGLSENSKVFYIPPKSSGIETGIEILNPNEIYNYLKKEKLEVCTIK